MLQPHYFSNMLSEIDYVYYMIDTLYSYYNFMFITIAIIFKIIHEIG